MVHIQSFPKLENGYPGPALFPGVLALLFFISGILLVYQGIRKKERLLRFSLEGVDLRGWCNIALVLGVIAAYIFLSERIGFLLFSFISLVALMQWLKVSLLKSIMMAAGATSLIYLLFGKMLLVPLPWGEWGL